MIDKKITLIIGNDIYNVNPKLFDDFQCLEYKAFFIDEFGSTRTMDYWSGDKFFGNYMEIFYFFGIDEEEESSKCKGLKIWSKEYATLNEKEKSELCKKNHRTTKTERKKKRPKDINISKNEEATFQKK